MAKRNLFITLLFVIIALPLWSQTLVDGICYNLDSESLTASVTYKTEYYYPLNVTIPETVTHDGKTYTVTAIGSSAFSGHIALMSITIPNSVTSIENYAFSGCKELTSITIPSGVTHIGSSAFSGCAELSSIIIPSGVASIGRDVFVGCEKLTDITILNSFTPIGQGAFHDTGFFAEQPDGVVYIGKVLYGYKGDMPENSTIEIKEGTECIADHAFQYYFHTGPNTGLTSVSIPNSVISIGQEAFSGCAGLTAIAIPNGVTSIGDKAFYNCVGVTSITISNSVTHIGNAAFSGCAEVASITIGSGVTIIKDSAFSGCAKLTAITIPNGITSIERHAFNECTRLSAIYAEPVVAPKLGHQAFYRANVPTDRKSVV